MTRSIAHAHQTEVHAGRNGDKRVGDQKDDGDQHHGERVSDRPDAADEAAAECRADPEGESPYPLRAIDVEVLTVWGAQVTVHDASNECGFLRQDETDLPPKDEDGRHALHQVQPEDGGAETERQA